MAFYPAHLRAFQEHFFIQERRRIHESLNSNIFEKIVNYDSEGNYTSPINRLKINYDLSKLQENSDYEEAKAHWEQDLKNAGPEAMEAQVRGLNQDIEEFFSVTLPNIVATAVKTNFTIYNKTNDVPPLNQISTPGVIKELERDWIENTGIVIAYYKESRRYDIGGMTVATIEPQHESDLNHIIKGLRSKDSPINLAILSFRLRRNSILKEIKEMNKEIENRIINPIKKGRYKTTCDKCDDNAISPKP
jgi:hypothetical protein